MREQIEIKVKPGEEKHPGLLKRRASQKLGITLENISDFKIIRQSIDARSKRPSIKILLEVFSGETQPEEQPYTSLFKDVKDEKEVIIVGAGPAGYFAALQFLELGIKPIIVERGKDVRSRRKDIKAIQRDNIVNPDSNYCFGEGGAGTFSDGKLYTRSHKRGNVKKILKLFIEFGAKDEIGYIANPHIGSNKLPQIISNIKTAILEHGGEILFNSKVTDFIIKSGTIKGVVVNKSEKIYGKAVILATGHSARDIFKLLDNHKIKIEAKPFALGIRVEHPQELIDLIQYGQKPRNKNLPPSEYRLTCQIDNRGVYSFCMCPGGLIVPAMTSPEEIVVNGMSLAKRNSEFANSGIVTEVTLNDLRPFAKSGVFAGIEFQKSIEQHLFNFGKGDLQAPAQRLTDFFSGKTSQTLSHSSYIPGIYPAPLHELLPKFVYQNLKKSLKVFDRKMKGFFTEEANIVGVESRTSSPVRIPRDKETKMHIEIKGLFPCGEGAGYAGGILSAAMDGQNVANATGHYVESK